MTNDQLEQKVIQNTIDFVRNKLSADGSGHDWWHVHRVYNNALALAKSESVDIFVVQLAALLHDIADWKFNNGDHSAGSRAAKEWLSSQGVAEKIIKHVCTIIDDISFRGAGEKAQMKSSEGMVVQDADRLDAIGAIGIARTFAYGGHKGRLMYDPEIKPELHETFEQYKNSTSPTINHFYEKLLLLKDLMNTESAKQIAAQRHAFMEMYLDRFFKEWEGLQ